MSTPASAADVTSPVPPVRPGLQAWVQLLLAEIRMVVRDTSGLVVPLGMPVLIMVMFGMQTTDDVLPGLDGLTAFDVYVVPLCLTIVVATIGVINMPSFLSMYRKGGVLRRLGVTPVHPSMVLVAQVVTSVLQTLVGIAIAVTTASVAFDLGAPRRLAATIGAFAMTALAMYAVGMLIAAIAPTANAAVAIGLITFFAFGAVGGLFGDPANLPDLLATIGELTPFGAGFQSIRHAWAGATIEVTHLVSLGVATVVSSVGAAVWFRWE